MFARLTKCGTRLLLAVTLVVSGGLALALAGPVVPVEAASPAFGEVRLVSDKPGLAQLTDAAVKNPWGVALGQGATRTPVWVADNGTGRTTVYAGANGRMRITKVLEVKLPAGPTGIVFNDTTGFVIGQQGRRGPATFVFDGVTNTGVGHVDAWKFVPPTPAAAAREIVRLPLHVYLGLALARTAQGPRLLAADIVNGRIDVYDSSFRLLSTPLAFVDPQVPKGFGPYNVAVLHGKVYVAFAPGGGAQPKIRGLIDVFDLRGALIRRLVTGGHLNDPWGLAIAPPNWGGFGGDLLVGNVDDGKINAFDARTGVFNGTNRDQHGRPIAHPGMWGLAFGNGVTGTPRTLLFAAGIDNYAHGLIGLIRPASG